MEKIMAFLSKHIGAFFAWWAATTKLPRQRFEWPNGRVIVVDWAFVGFWALVAILMVVFLPGGLLFR